MVTVTAINALVLSTLVFGQFIVIVLFVILFFYLNCSAL